MLSIPPIEVETHGQDLVTQAALVMAELMASFGAGYAIQANRESPITGELPDPAALPDNPPQIRPPVAFVDPAVLKPFALNLLATAINNRDQLPWTAENPQRRSILKIAFLHGMFARLLVTSGQLDAITHDVLEQSLRLVQHWCNSGGGGGPACPF